MGSSMYGAVHAFPAADRFYLASFSRRFPQLSPVIDHVTRQGVPMRAKLEAVLAEACKILPFAPRFDRPSVASVVEDFVRDSDARETARWELVELGCRMPTLVRHWLAAVLRVMDRDGSEDRQRAYIVLGMLARLMRQEIAANAPT